MMGLPIRRLDRRDQRERRARRVLPHRRATARAASAETHATSSPSMDISKASNFERFVFDLVGRDPATVARAVAASSTRRRVRPRRHAAFRARRAASASSPARSTHADRLATIRDVDRRYGVVVDPHTADGIKVGLEHREPGVPLVCLETALPAKFAATIREALGRAPARPAGLRGSRIAAAALRGDRRRRRSREGVHRPARGDVRPLSA